MIQALNADPAGLRYMNTGGSANRVTSVGRPHAPEGFPLFCV